MAQQNDVLPRQPNVAQIAFLPKVYTDTQSKYISPLFLVCVCLFLSFVRFFRFSSSHSFFLFFPPVWTIGSFSVSGRHRRATVFFFSSPADGRRRRLRQLLFSELSDPRKKITVPSPLSLSHSFPSRWAHSPLLRYSIQLHGLVENEREKERSERKTKRKKGKSKEKRKKINKHVYIYISISSFKDNKGRVESYYFICSRQVNLSGKMTRIEKKSISSSNLMAIIRQGREWGNSRRSWSFPYYGSVSCMRIRSLLNCNEGEHQHLHFKKSTIKFKKVTEWREQKTPTGDFESGERFNLRLHTFGGGKAVSVPRYTIGSDRLYLAKEPSSFA